MKRGLLLLGAILAAGASLQAKEIQPPVVIVEEKVEEFKPSATIAQELGYYGPIAGNDNVSRYQFTPVVGSAQITEQHSFDFRARFNTGHGNNDTDFRTRWYYDHPSLGDTKIKWTDRLRLEKTTKFQSGQNYEPDSQQLVLGLTYLAEYEMRFNFADYFPEYDYFKVDNFAVAPAYAYMWSDTDSSNDASTLGIDFYSNYTLPWGFSAEFNVYLMRTWTSKARLSNVGKPVIVDGEATYPDVKFTKNYSSVAVEFFLYNTTKLWESQDQRTKLTFEFEGGFDPFLWTSKNLTIFDINDDIKDTAGTLINAGTAQLSDKTYYLKAIPELRITHKLTKDTTAYIRLKGEYGNQVNVYQIAKDWKWQPQAVIGWETKF